MSIRSLTKSVDHYECSSWDLPAANYIDGGVAVRDATLIDANQSADVVSATGNATVSLNVSSMESVPNRSKRAGSPVSRKFQRLQPLIRGPRLCSQNREL